MRPEESRTYCAPPASAEQPVTLLLSGPAADILGGEWAAKLDAREYIITFDVGGTSADIGIVTPTRRPGNIGLEGTPVNDCSRKVDTFGLPSTLTDSDANREIFEEQDRHPGLEEVNVGCTVMSTTQQVIVEQLERFATEV